MEQIQRVFLIVLDSVGIGALPDAADYGDAGRDTLRSCFNTGVLHVPVMERLGLFNIDGIDYGTKCPAPLGAYGRLAEASPGKDTTIGHWELAGIISPNALPTYPDGFPADLVARFEAATGYTVLCNKPYSGTEVLKDYGETHLATEKSVILYTSADSVFQVAAHVDKVPLEELYRICEIARGLLVGEHGVGRVIARPFTGVYPFERMAQRRDFSIKPPRETVLDALEKAGLETIGVGKIEDIFAGVGITRNLPKKGNPACMEQTEKLIGEDFRGLCFVNLVDFDMVFGHRNNAAGYAEALNEFD
ncbi:MAG: phosphopentomutase, partial [Oscillospiraceae bacterium]|nr:phosphopentomutase [Oscillospiraceae bacterium]